MKKLALFSALFALIVTLFFVACKKDEAQPSNALDYANPNNPYDFVGAKHNEGLDILKANKTGQGLNMAQDFQILAAHGFGDGDYKAHAENFAIMLSSRDPIKAIMAKFRNEARVSENLYAAMLQLDEIVSTKGLSKELTPAVKTFEVSIPSLNLKEKETEILYCATSIARFSNTYWMAEGKTSSADRDIWRTIAIVAGDIAAGVGAGLEGGSVEDIINAASDGSDLVRDLWDSGSIAAGPTYGWPWGGGIMGYPCNPGWACPCTIEMDPLNIGPYYMAGTGFTLSDDVVALVMDGSGLDPVFRNMISGGTFDLATNFTVPQNIVEHLYTSGNFPIPAEPTVFTQGLKEVIQGDGTYTIVFPVTYLNNSSSVWCVTISGLQ
ncbi:MAG: hypothetical protein H7246_13355 [Phycisphaerae bacterium]|nr:hypothetical protein [Saprospiraceae bacterium]